MTDLDSLYDLFLSRSGHQKELAKCLEQQAGFKKNVDRCEEEANRYRQKISDLEEKIRKAMR